MKWSGTDERASFSYTGGNKPSGNDQRLPENLFDNNLNTTWHGIEHGATLTVTFSTVVRFRYLDWTVGPENVEQEKYKGACLHDGDNDSEIACFPTETTYNAGETYRITGYTDSHQFVFKLPREGAGAELKIGYELIASEGKFRFQATNSDEILNITRFVPFFILFLYN